MKIWYWRTEEAAFCYFTSCEIYLLKFTTSSLSTAHFWVGWTVGSIVLLTNYREKPRKLVLHWQNSCWLFVTFSDHYDYRHFVLSRWKYIQNIAPFGTFFYIFFVPSGLILVLKAGPKTFMRPTYVDYQYLICKSLSLSKLFGLFFLHFLGSFGAFFWWLGLSEKLFGTYLF